MKGLARILGTLSLWMALGFALFPTLYEKLYTAAGETMDTTAVELYAMIMVPTWLVIGIILLAYGSIGRRKARSSYDPGPQAPKDQ